MLKERRIRFPRSVDESIFQSALRGKRIRFLSPPLIFCRKDDR